MIGIFGPASLWARETIALGLDVSLKATVLVLLALAIHLGSGRRRALFRSVLWNACLLGLLVLPVAAVAFPGLRVACLPGPEAPAMPDPGGEAVAPPEMMPAPLDGPNPIGLPLIRPQAPASRLDWASAILLAYVAIAAALAARLALSLGAVGALVRAGVPVEERPWVEALGRWRGRLGLSRAVRLARSRRVGVPVVVGWLRPTILLPEALVEPDAPRAIDAILLHELAHVRRGDYPWNLLLRLVQAIYWPHPLVWPVGRIVAGVREQACDDLCVSWLGGTADYRATLLELASGLVRRPGPSLGLAMSRATKLGRRLAWIERNEGASRCLLGWPSRAAVAVAVVAAVGVLGSVKLARSASASAPPPEAEGPKAQGEARLRDDRAFEPDAPDRKGKPPRVRVERLRRGDIRRTSTQTCTVHAFQSADLFAKVSGFLKSQAVDIGDRVKRGDVLAVIEAPELTKEADRAAAAVVQAKAMYGQATVRVETAGSEVKAAESMVAQAQAEAARHASARKYREKELARYKELFAQKAVTQEIVDEHQERLDAIMAAQRSTEAAVTTAKANLATAQNKVDQAKADFSEVKANLEVTEAILAKARIMVDYTRLISPYDGIVTRRSFHPGDFARAPDAGVNVPVFTVARTDAMRAIVQVPDRDVPFVDRGDPAEVRFDALPGRVFRGKVDRFSGSEDPQTRTMRTEVDLPNPDGAIRDGMSGIATIVLEPLPEALTIPVTAIVGPVPADGGQDACFRVEGGRAIRTPINFRFYDGERAVVLEGLKEGDVVIVSLPDAVPTDGQPVEVEPAADAGGGPQQPRPIR